MRKRSIDFRKKKNILIFLVQFALIIMIFMISTGFSVLNQNLFIDDAKLIIRVKADIRVTGISVSNDGNFETNGALSYWEEYNVKHIQSYVSLPNKNSQIKYKIQITNFGNAEMGILNITGLPDYLDYKIENYNLKDKICVEDNCKLGIKKDIYLIVKYKDDINLPEVTNFIVDLDFDFRPFHKITYVNFVNNYTKDYAHEIIDGDTFTMELKKPFPIGAKPFLKNIAAEYQYDKDTLVVENVNDDLEIRSNYIQTIEDLIVFDNNINNGTNYIGETIYLDKDLDFKNDNSYRDASRIDFDDYNGDDKTDTLIKELQTGSGFIPIGFVDETTDGDRTNHFSGTFDGQEHTISNLYINNNVVTHATGFFGYIEKASIRNFTLEGKVTSSAFASIAGVVAFGKDSVIDNVTNRANVSIDIGRYQTAGIIANAGGMVISNCKNYGNISNGNHTGGIVAIVGNGIDKKETTITNSYNYGTISNNQGSTAVGGIVGHQVNKEVGLLTIEGCENNGTITVDGSTATEQKVGGIIGIVRSKAIINDSTNKGEIVGHLSKTPFNFNGGGIIGRIEGNAIVRNCHNLGQIKGEYRMGGIVGNINSGGTAYVIDSHNEGTLAEAMDYQNNNAASGGILGYGNNIHIFIINSYNKGVINGYQAGGLIGAFDTTTGDSAFVINTYNAGPVTSKHNYAGGLFGHLNQADLRVDNVYNLGTITGQYKYNIGYINTTTSHVVNRTYHNGLIDASNQSYNWTTMADATMRSASFAETLNSNIQNVDISEMKQKLISVGLIDEDYDIHMHHWDFNEELKYPTIRNEH